MACQQEHGGDLNEAVNEHFREGDVHRYHISIHLAQLLAISLVTFCVGVFSFFETCFTFVLIWFSTSPSSTAPPQYNFAQVSNQNQVAPQQGLLPLLSVARSFKPSLLLDRNYSRDLYNRIGSALTGRAPSPSHPGEVTGVPVGLSPGQRPTIPDVAKTELDASRYGNDVEEEMIQAAIEASKREAERGSPNVHNRNLNV